MTISNVEVLIFIIIGAYSLYFLLYSWYRRPSRRFPPGPLGLPVVGYIPFLGPDTERSVYQLSKTYGPVLSVPIGMDHCVFLNDWDSIHQAFVKQSHKFSGRPSFPFFASASISEGLSFFDYCDGYKAQRKFGATTFRRFGMETMNMENWCLEELEYLNEAIRSKQGKPFDICILLHKAVANGMCNLFMGKRFDYDDPEYEKILRIVIQTFDDPTFTAVSRLLVLLPQLMSFPPFSRVHKSFLKDSEYVSDWLARVIDDHLETFQSDDPRDFIDSFILQMQKKQDPLFTKNQLIEYIREMFAAGAGSTSNTLHWSLLCLLHHPDSQKKLRNEILKTAGSSGAIRFKNKVEMPYTNAFIAEVFRYRTTSPLGVVHKTNEEAELYGYVIPKNTKVFSNIWAVHNDTEVWDKPHTFFPERFLDEDGKFSPSNHVIPFSEGPRRCIGEQIAKIEMFLYLVGILQKYEFLPDLASGKLPDIENGCNNGLAFVPRPYKLLAKKM